MSLPLLLSLASVTATANPALFERRWEPLAPGERVTLESLDGAPLGGQLLDGRERATLRASCPAGVRPERVLLTPEALVTGAFSEPLADGAHWQFPAATSLSGPWLITGDGCQLEALGDGFTRLGFLRLEQEAADEQGLQAEVSTLQPFGASADAWLSASQPSAAGAAPTASPDRWLERYETLRPPVEPLRPRRLFTPDGLTAPEAARSPFPASNLADAEPESLWFAEAPRFTGVAPWVKSPARLVVRARRVGAASELCLLVDGAAHCLPAPDATQVAVTEGGVAPEPLRYGAQPVSLPLVWRVRVGAGPHTLALSAPALASVEVSELPERGQDTAPLVYPPACHAAGSELGGAACANDPTSWRPLVAGPERPSDIVTLLLPPTNPRGNSATAASGGAGDAGSAPSAVAPRWVPLEDLAAPGLDGRTRTTMTPAGLPWIDERGTAELWLSGERCDVRLPSSERFLGVPEETRARFRFVGAPSAAAALPLPEVRGCSGWLRVLPPAPGAEASPTAPAPEGARIATRYERLLPGARLTLDGSTAAVERALSVAWPANRGTPFELHVAGPAGTETYRIAPLARRGQADAEVVPGADGASYAPPLRLPLDIPARAPVAASLGVSASAPLLVRVTERGVFPAEPVASPQPEAGDGGSGDGGGDQSSEEARLAALQRLARELAEAPSAELRAKALLARSVLLERLDFAAQAAAERSWALALVPPAEPSVEPEPPEARELAARALLGERRWVAVSRGWTAVSSEPGATSEASAQDATLDALAARDHLVLARALAAPADRALAWRDAILGGQVLTGEERVQAYVELVSAGHAEEPGLWPLRSLSTWEPLLHLGGSARRVTSPKRAEATPSADAALGARVEATGFPDLWPAARVLRLADGQELRLAATRAPLEVQARCRARSQGAALAGCRATVTTERGESLSTVPLSPLGTPVRLDLPRGNERLYVRIDAAPGTARELLVPEALAAARDAQDPRAWFELRAQQGATVDLVGPTVLRLETRSETPVSFQVQSSEETAPLATADATRRAGEALFVVPQRGPQRLTLVASAPVLVTASLRVPKASGAELTADTAALAAPAPAQTLGALDADGDAGAEAREPERVVPTLVRGRPIATPPLTGVFGAEAGTEPVRDEPEQSSEVHALLSAGAAARLGSAPLWLDGSVLGVLSDGALTQGRVNAEWWPLNERFRLSGELNLRAAYGAPGGQGLTTLKGRVGARGGYWLARDWLTELELGYTERAAVAGRDRDGAGYGKDPTLWSSYQEQHPRGLQPELSLRWVAGHWVWLSVVGAMNTGPEITGTPDFARVDARLALGGPAWAGALSGRFERRFDDGTRRTPYDNPSVGLVAWRTFWPSGNLALQPSVEALYQFHYEPAQAFSFVAGLKAFWSRDRGLQDLRPSTTLFRDAALWEQDRAADETYGVIP